MADDLERRVEELERKVSQLYSLVERSEPSGDPGAPSDDVLTLVQQGKKIEAIKLHREQTGAGLAEAKEAVERYEALG